MKSKLINNDDANLLRCGQFLILYHYLSTTKPVAMKDVIGAAFLLALCKGATRLGIPLNLTTAVLVGGFLAKKTITDFFATKSDSQKNSQTDVIQPIAPGPN